MKKLSLAVIGCGDFGQQMLEFLNTLPAFKISAVCDPDSQKSMALGKTFGVPSFKSFEQCLKETDASAVALFTPNHLHAPMAISAAKSGKHIFCEKPMALNVRECYSMIEAAEANQVKLMVGHKRRFRPQYVKISEIVSSLKYGRPLMVQINGFYGRKLWGWWTKRAMGGGLLFHSGVHDLDFLRSICGETATIFARSPIKTNHHTDFEDAISLVIHFESGTVGTVQVSPFSFQRTFRESFGIHIVFEKGDLIYDPVQVSVKIKGESGNSKLFHFDNETGFKEAYKTEFESFANWVLYDSEPKLTAWDGLRCVELMEAAQLSAYSGKQIKLPLPKHPDEKAIFGKISLTRNLNKPTLFAQGFSMAEGPAFDREGNLFIANCRSDHISKILPNGKINKFLSTGGKTQGVAISPSGEFFITDSQKKMIFQANINGEISDFCHQYEDGSPLRGPNEIIIGPNGQIYFTDPGKAWRGKPTGAVSRISKSGKAELLADGLEFTNGLDFSPDGKMIYVVETTTGKILCSTLDINGTLKEPLHEFVRFEGSVGPDGIRFADSGNLYVTLFGRGQVAIVDPEGKIIDRLRVPGLFPTNVIFLNSSLLVCEGQTGAIWRLDIGEKGIPSYSQKIWLADKSIDR